MRNFVCPSSFKNCGFFILTERVMAFIFSSHNPFNNPNCFPRANSFIKKKQVPVFYPFSTNSIVEKGKRTFLPLRILPLRILYPVTTNSTTIGSLKSIKYITLF